MISAECWNCQGKVREGEHHQINVWGDTDTTHVVCATCAENYAKCAECRTLTDQTGTIRYGTLERCYTCLDVNSTVCDLCDDWVMNYDIRSDSTCYDCYSCDCCECDCSDCYPDGSCGDCSMCNPQDMLYSYDYQPIPIFHNSDTTTGHIPGTPYLGLELEIDTSYIEESAELLNSDLIYCKEDSTVDGLEMVTHPMTLEAAKRLLPFQDLRTLRNDYSASAWNNGIHVHVSRDGFKSDSHIYRWMKLIYRNSGDVRRHARRNPNQWASFDETDRRIQKRTAEKRFGARRRGRDYTRRYAAINVENRNTFEVRVFRGSLRKDEILAALELVAASVEYTRHMTVPQAITGGLTWDAFISWADKQGDTYRNLVNLDVKTQPSKEERDAKADLERKRQEALRLNREANRAERERNIAAALVRDLEESRERTLYTELEEDVQTITNNILTAELEAVFRGIPGCDCSACQTTNSIIGAS